MATVSFAQLTANFDLTTILVSFAPAAFLHDPGNWEWQEGDGTDVAFLSSANDFVYDGNFYPMAGTVTSFALDFNTLDLFIDLSITGLSFDVMAIAGPIFSSSLSDDEQADLIWRVVLAGADTINLGSSGVNITFAGDGRHVENGQSLFGGADSITGSAGGVTGGAIIGDYLSVHDLAIAHGGNDTIDAAAAAINGDAGSVAGFMQGGNDLLQSSGGASWIVGDVYTVTGTVVGGNDVIDATNVAEADGDVFLLDAGGLLVGGDDSIIGGGVTGQLLIGDANTVQSGSNAQGGNDTILGGSNDEEIYGDFFDGNTTGIVHGGNDQLFGYGGNDSIHGGGGNDLIDGGTGIDELHGDDGDDTLYVGTQSDLVAGEIYDGGTGNDVLDLHNNGLNYDFDLTILGTNLQSIERLQYGLVVQGTSNSVTLLSSQFGAGISLTAAIDGTSGFATDHLIVNMDTATINLSDLVVTNFDGANENVQIEGGSGAETITGTLVNDVIESAGGADAIDGYGGNDILFAGVDTDVDTIAGGAGNDTIVAFQGQSADSVDGGANTDTLDLSGLNNDSGFVNLSAGQWSTNAGGGLEDITGVEIVIGGISNDTIIGGSATNTLRGNDGNDEIHTTDLNMSSGEIYDGGAGNGDTLFVDAVAPYPNALPYSANFRTATVLGFEGLTFGDSNPSGTGVIQFLASQIGPGLSASAVVAGNVAGTDTIEILEVTMGAKTSVNLSAMTFTNWATTAAANNKDHVVISGGTVAANIIGSKVNDAITGSASNDTVRGGLGSDTMDGAVGTGDTADYSDKGAKVTVTLAGSTLVNVTIGAAIEDQIQNFENLIGGAAGDALTGNAGNNVFRGGGGKDTMDGAVRSTARQPSPSSSTARPPRMPRTRSRTSRTSRAARLATR